MGDSPSLWKIKKERKESEVYRRKKKYRHTEYSNYSCVTLTVFFFIHTLTRKIANKQLKIMSERKHMIEPWNLVCLVAIWWQGRKSWGGGGGKKRAGGGAGSGRGTQRLLFLGLGRLGWISRRGDRSPRSHSSPSTIRIQFLICWLQNL